MGRILSHRLKGAIVLGNVLDTCCLQGSSACKDEAQSATRSPEQLTTAACADSMQPTLFCNRASLAFALGSISWDHSTTQRPCNLHVGPICEFMVLVLHDTTAVGTSVLVGGSEVASVLISYPPVARLRLQRGACGTLCVNKSCLLRVGASSLPSDDDPDVEDPEPEPDPSDSDAVAAVSSASVGTKLDADGNLGPL